MESLGARLLAVSECMFEAVGVLQRDAPVPHDGPETRAQLERYQQLRERYGSLLRERIGLFLQALERVETLDMSCDDHVASIRERLADGLGPSMADLARTIEQNEAERTRLIGLFNDLVNARFFPA